MRVSRSVPMREFRLAVSVTREMKSLAGTLATKVGATLNVGHRLSALRQVDEVVENTGEQLRLHSWSIDDPY